MEDVKLIPISEAMNRLNLSRTTIDRKCREGVFEKFSLPGSSKVYLDEKQIASAFQPKKQRV